MSSHLGVRGILLSQTGSRDFIEKNREVFALPPPPAFCSENDHLDHRSPRKTRDHFSPFAFPPSRAHLLGSDGGWWLWAW